MKIEVVITIWNEGLYKLRRIIEADNIHTIREEFETTVDSIEEYLIKEEESKPVVDDDDIPF